MRRLAAVAVVLLTALTVPAPALAAPGFAAEIVSFEPSLPTSDAMVTLNVRVSNPSSIDLTGLEARFLVSTAPLSGRSQIPVVLSGRSLPTYRLVEPAAASGIDLPSGASTTITVQATPRQLGLLGSRPGAYVFGVQLDGTAGGRNVTERRVTFLPWQPGAADQRLGVVTVWTLTAPPSRGIDGVFIDDGLARSVRAGGRLRLQLDAMREVPQAVWLVDPLLAESVQALANGARIAGTGGDTRAATDVEIQAAAQWLTDLRAASSTGTIAALPLGDLDVRAALKFGRLSVLRSALGQSPSRLAAVMKVPSVPLIVPLYGGAITNSAWRLLHSLGASAAVASDQGYPPAQTKYTPSSAVAVDAFQGTVLAADHIIGATPGTSGLTSASARQAFAAQLLMTYLERPNSNRVITVAIPPTWMPDAAVATAGVLNARWIAPASLQQAEAAGTESRGTQITMATRGQRLQNRDLGNAVEGKRLLAHLTTDPGFTAQINDVVNGTLSRWFTARRVNDRFSATCIADLRALAASVRVVTRGEIVFGGEKGAVPVTVANGLPVAVDLTLLATGFPSVRVEPSALTRIHINAGKRVSVEVPTRVTGSGDAYLGLQLQTADSTTLDGTVLLTVRSAAYARVAGYLVLGAFALLLLLVVANTIKRIRHRGSDEDDA